MALYVDIKDRKNLNLLLQSLKHDTLPAWGKMRAQEMIEHLVENIEYTNGTRIPSLQLSPEEAQKEKLAKVTPEFEIPKNVNGNLPVMQGNKRFSDLQTAIHELNKALDQFEIYFQQQGQTTIHGGFGPLNYSEWILWHGKHFAHHFAQFGLIK
jgi:hypothetical protein